MVYANFHLSLYNFINAQHIPIRETVKLNSRTAAQDNSHSQQTACWQA